jgi:hypothetical protein
MSESYEPKLVHLPGTKLTPRVTFKRMLEDVREDKYKRRVDGLCHHAGRPNTATGAAPTWSGAYRRGVAS